MWSGQCRRLCLKASNLSTVNLSEVQKIKLEARSSSERSEL
jgi:hypothetical protein